MHLDRNYGVDLPKKLKLEESKEEREREREIVLFGVNQVGSTLQSPWYELSVECMLQYIMCHASYVVWLWSPLPRDKNPKQHKVKALSESSSAWGDTSDHVNMFTCLIFSLSSADTLPVPVPRPHLPENRRSTFEVALYYEMNSNGSNDKRGELNQPTSEA